MQQISQAVVYLLSYIIFIERAFKQSNDLFIHTFVFNKSFSSISRIKKGQKINYKMLSKLNNIIVIEQTRAMLSVKQSIQSFYAIQMDGNNYPFGQLSEALNEQQLVLVHKALTFENQTELQILTKMSLFLKNLDNNYLIALHHTQKTTDHKYHFYYQYVPLTLEKWILELGQELMQELYFQMLNLVSYLTQNGIKFKFDPRNIGLSKDIKLKYFISEFSIDNDKKMTNFKQISEQVQYFFTQFKSSIQQKSDEGDKNSFLIDRKSADCANLLGSIGTRQSWQIKSNKSSNSGKISMAKNMNLSIKIENSKKRSLQILQKLRNLKHNKGNIE